MAETTAKSTLQVDPNPAVQANTAERHVLLLQGPSSLFFRDLGRALIRRKAKVTRVAFTAGDRLYWSKSSGDVVWFRDRKEAYAAWIKEICLRLGVTDVVMLGDGRFYHRVVAEMIRAGDLAVRLHVVEHGLMRPGLILVDPDGLGGNSLISKNFAASSHAADPPFSARPRGGSFAEYAAMDVAYHLASLIGGPIVNRNYVRHSLDHPVTEHLGWIKKAATRPVRAWQRRAAERCIAGWGDVRILLFPLQLATDFQVRDHGAGETLEATLSRVVESFAAHAAPNARLVIKRHPLDNGWIPWRRIIALQVARLGLEGRIEYVDGGSLEALLGRVSGVVTINSTVGLTAILSGVPCCVLGTAVYDIDGLTTSGGLDVFWRKPIPPDPALAERFRAFLLAEYHVPGAFDGPGSRVGAENVAELICEGRAA